jgi:methylglyoxal synthase
MTPKTPIRLALVAHDAKKDAMVSLAREFEGLLAHCTICTTGTTGTRIEAATRLRVEKLLSGPLGGDLQIGARLAVGEVDAVIFLRDPMKAQPHEPDINALVRACDVHNKPCMTNEASARIWLAWLGTQIGL